MELEHEMMRLCWDKNEGQVCKIGKWEETKSVVAVNTGNDTMK